MREDNLNQKDAVSLNKKLAGLLAAQGLGQAWATFLKSFQALAEASGSQTVAQLRMEAIQAIQGLPDSLNSSIIPASQQGAKMVHQMGETVIPVATQRFVQKVSEAVSNRGAVFGWGRRLALSGSIGLSSFIASLTIQKQKWAEFWFKGLKSFVVPIFLSLPFFEMRQVVRGQGSVARQNPKGWRQYILPVLLAFSIVLPATVLQAAEAAQLIDNGAYVLVEKGDRVWSIAREDLKSAGTAKVTNKMVAERVEQYASENPGIDLAKIIPGQHLLRPGNAGGGASAVKVSIENGTFVLSPASETPPSEPPQLAAPSSPAEDPSVVPSPATPPSVSVAEPVSPVPITTPDSAPSALPPAVPSPPLSSRNEEPVASEVPTLLAGGNTTNPPAVLAAWLAGLFGGIGGLVSIVRRRNAPRTSHSLARKIADELKKGPRTFPERWWTPILRQYLYWTRDDFRGLRKERRDLAKQNNPNAMKKRRDLLEEIEARKASIFPRYNNYGSHGRLMSYVGIFEIKRRARQAEKANPQLAELSAQLKQVKAQLRALGDKDETVLNDSSRAEFSDLRESRERIEREILDLRIEIQRNILNGFMEEFDRLEVEVLGGQDELREQREVMWRAARRTYEFYQDKLIPQGVIASTTAIFFLSSAKILRVGFAFLFLFSVFFFPSPVLVVVSWVVLFPLLYSVTKTVVLPMLVTFLMFLSVFFDSLAPQGHRRVEFLSFVRQFYADHGRPYAFSIEVPKMSGNPLDPFIKDDVIVPFFSLHGNDLKTLKTEHDFSGNPWSAVSLPPQFTDSQKDSFTRFVQLKFWSGFRLHVRVEFFEKKDREGKSLGMYMKVFPDDSPVVNNLRRGLNKVAGGRLEINSSVDLEIKNESQLEIRVLDYAASSKDLSSAREALGDILKSDYNLAIENSEIEQKGTEGIFVERVWVPIVTFRFQVERAYVGEIRQNMDMTTRYLDTFHLEADVWAAYRRRDMDALAQTLRDSGKAFTVSFVMPSNTSYAPLIPYEMELIQNLQAEADQRFGPGRVRFLYLSQGIEWMDQSAIDREGWKKKLNDQDPIASLDSKTFTLFAQGGGRDHFRLTSEGIVHTRTTAGGARSVETLSREQAIQQIRILRETTDLVIPWKTAGWGKKLGNVAGLEWLKMGFTRPPAYTSPVAHENFTNPDSPIFPRANVFAGDLLGYFSGTVRVRQVDGSKIDYTIRPSDPGVVDREVGGKRDQLSLADANKMLAVHMADPYTDQFLARDEGELHPNDLSLVLDDKNSIVEGAVEAVISTAEHPENYGVVGFNPMISVDAPMTTRGGRIGGSVTSVFLNSLDEARRIHNKSQALFMANLFGGMSPMYGKLAKRAEYGRAFLNEFIVVSRALSHDWQESIFSFVESVYGALTFRFELVNQTPREDGEDRSITYTYRMRQGSRTDFVQMEFGRLGIWSADVLEAKVSLLGPDGNFHEWRTFSVPAEESPQDAMRRVSRYLSGAFEITERDLLTRTGAMERDFRWLRGDIQMFLTTTPYDHDALPPAHQFHRMGIDFRLFGDARFLGIVVFLVGLAFFMDQAFLVNAMLAAGLLGFVMIGVAGQGLFLYPTIYDVLRVTMVQHSTPKFRRVARWGHSLVRTVWNFALFIPKVLLSTLMSLDIAIKRSSFVPRSWAEELKSLPSVWKTSTSRAVREMLGFRLKEVWKEETQKMNLPFLGGMAFLVFSSIVAAGNAFMAVLWPMGPMPLLASQGVGWYLGHLSGVPFRVTNRRTKIIQTIKVYGVAFFVASLIFLSPVNYVRTYFDTESLRPPPPAELVTTQMASPLTRPPPLLSGIPVFKNVVPALEIEKLNSILTVAPRVHQPARNIGAGIPITIVSSPDHFTLTSQPDPRPRLPMVTTQGYTSFQADPVNSLALLEKPKLTESQTEKLAYLLSQLDRMNSSAVKKQNLGIYGGSTALLTLVPGLGNIFKAADWATYANVLATMDYPWMKEPMVAKYWAQTALLMDLNAEEKPGEERAVKSMKEIADLLLWTKVKDVWDVDYTPFVEAGRTLKDPRNGTVLLSEEDYRSLADRVSGSMDKYELISAAVLNLHYGMGVPLDEIDGARVWHFIRLSHELETAWNAAVPNANITPMEFLPRPVSKLMRVVGNITFFLPIQIPVLSDLRLEMIPMIGAFYQEPGGMREFFTQLLKKNEADLRASSGENYVAEFLKRVGADYIRVHLESKPYPALETLVRERMVRDMAKLHKTPSDKDIRLAYLQTEYNLGRIALFNRNGVEATDPARIRQAALKVAAHLTDVQSIAQMEAPVVYARYMKFEPGILEVEGILRYLLENDSAKSREYNRIFLDGLRTAESIRRGLDRDGGRLSPAYIDYVMSLFPAETTRGMTDAAKEYNALRDLAMLSLNLGINHVLTPDGQPYTPQEIMRELLLVKKRVADYRLPDKPGILASHLLHWLKTKSDHPEVTEKQYWDENQLPILADWAKWSASPALLKTLQADPSWAVFSNKVNGEIEKAMGITIRDADVRQFNAIKSVAQLVDATLRAFPHLQKRYSKDPAFAAKLILAMAQRSIAYDTYFATLPQLPSSAVGFKEFFVVAGYEVNGMNGTFDPGSGFAREVKGFVLQPINDLWNAGLYETLPPAFVNTLRIRMAASQRAAGATRVTIKPEDLKFQSLRAYYELADAALYNVQAPKPLGAYGPSHLRQIREAGKILMGHIAAIYQQAEDLPGVRDYIEKESGILENEAIQIFLLEKKSTEANKFDVGSYMGHSRVVFKKLEQILQSEAGITKTPEFSHYRAIRVELLSESSRERMTERGKDFLALRSLANLIVNAEFNDMRKDGPLADRSLSPQGWMAQFVDTWDHFAQGAKYSADGGQTYRFVPYREEGFVDMVALFKQKWGYAEFWKEYFYPRLRQVEFLMDQKDFQSYIKSPGGEGPRFLEIINEDIRSKSGIFFQAGHPIHTFNGVMGISEMMLDALKKFPGYPVQYKTIAERYLAYHHLFYVEKKFQNLPFDKEGFIESLVTGGYVFGSQGGQFKDEIRIMRLKDVNGLMGTKLLAPETKFQGKPLREQLETIIKQESVVPVGVPVEVLNFFIFQKIAGIAQTYSMLTGLPEADSNQPTLNLKADLPQIEQAMKALVYVHSEIRRKTEAGVDVYPKLRPIFEILGENEKWVGRMHELGIMEEGRFYELFSGYIDVLEASYDELKGTFLSPEELTHGARYAGELGNYLKTLRENLRKDASIIESRLVVRKPKNTDSVVNPENDEGDGGPEARLIFVRPEIDASQYILDTGFITAHILKQMVERIDEGGEPVFKGLTTQGLLSLYAKTQTHLKTKHYKDALIRVQSLNDAMEIGQLNGLINNYALKFAIIDYFVFSSDGNPEIARFLAEHDVHSIEQFIDRFYKNLQFIRNIPELSKALDELRTANEYSAEGVEFSYAMMLTLNDKISPEFMERFSKHIPNILRDYSDYLTREGGSALKFRIDSAVVLYEALAREMAETRLVGRPLGDLGDRIEVKQKRVNSPWMSRTIVKAVYGSLFGIYLDERVPADKDVLDQWEKKARSMSFSQIVEDLLAAPTIRGEVNPYKDEIRQVEEAIALLIKERTAADREGRITQVEGYTIQIDQLKKNLASLNEKKDYLLLVAKSLEKSYVSGIDERNDGYREILLLAALLGMGFGLRAFRRGEGKVLFPASVALASGLVAFYIVNPNVLVADVTNPKLLADWRSVVSEVPYAFKPFTAPHVLFDAGGYQVYVKGSDERPVHQILYNGYVISQMDLEKGSYTLFPPPVPGGAGVQYPLSEGPPILLGGYFHEVPGKASEYVHGGRLSDIRYSIDASGKLLLQATVQDPKGLLTMKDYTMTFAYEDGRTVANVGGTWVASQNLDLDYMKPMGQVSSISTTRSVAEAEIRPYVSESLQITSARGDVVRDLSLSDLPPGVLGTSTNLLESPLGEVTLSGSRRHNSPAVTITVNGVEVSSAEGAVYPARMGATYTLEPLLFPQSPNVAVAPLLESDGKTNFALPKGSSVHVNYSVSSVSPDGPLPPGITQTQPTADVVSPPVSAPQTSFFWQSVLLGLGVAGLMAWRWNIFKRKNKQNNTPGKILPGLLLSFVLGGLLTFGNVPGALALSSRSDSVSVAAKTTEVAPRETVLLNEEGWRVRGISDSHTEIPPMQTPWGSFSELLISLNAEYTFNVRGNGFLQSIPPGMDPGTEWVTPGYWSEGRYHHGTPISEIKEISLNGQGGLTLTGVLTDGVGNWTADDFRIQFYAREGAPLMDVAFTAIARKPFKFDPVRIKNHEAFKAGQFVSMNIRGDSQGDVVLYAGSPSTLIKGDLGVQERMLFENPRPLGPGRLLSLEIDRPEVKRYNPTTFIFLSNNMNPNDFVPQGFVQRSRNPKIKNANVWISANVQPETYTPGQVIGRFEYTLGATPIKMFGPDGPKILGIKTDRPIAPTPKAPVKKDPGFIRRLLKWFGFSSKRRGSGVPGHGKSVEDRNRLNEAASAFFDQLNRGSDMAGQPPTAFLVLGNPFPQAVRDFAARWKEEFQGIPIVLAGGRGAGTAGLLAAITKHYSVDENQIALQLTQTLRDSVRKANPIDAESLTEADLLRFVLQKEGIPDDVIRQESKASSNLEENFDNTSGQLALLGLGIGTPRVGVVTGAPMRLRVGAVVAGLKTKLNLPYGPVVMDVGPQDLDSMTDEELLPLIKGRAGEQWNEGIGWKTALNRPLTSEERILESQLEMARQKLSDELKLYEATRNIPPQAQSILGTSLVLFLFAHLAAGVGLPFGSLVLYGLSFAAMFFGIRVFSVGPFRPGVVLGRELQGMKTGFMRLTQSGINFGSWAAEQILKTPALLVAIVLGVVGVAGAAGVVGAGVVGSVGVGTSGSLSSVGVPVLLAMTLAAVPIRAGVAITPFRYNIPPYLPSFERGSGFLAVPGVRATGNALVVDMRKELGLAEGKILLDRLISLSHGVGAGEEAHLHVEFVVNGNPSAADVARVTKAFRELAAQSNLDQVAIDQITVGVVGAAPAVLTARLKELSSSHINVVAPASAVEFWAGLGMPLVVFAAKLLTDLTRVEVDIVYTGAAAQAAVELSNGQLKMEKGQVRLRALSTPLEMIEEEKQKIQVFNQQA